MDFSMNPDNGHYYGLKIQPNEYCHAILSQEQLEGAYLFNAIKYLSRFNMKASGKGGLKDLLKAREYLEWLIELESDE